MDEGGGSVSTTGGFLSPFLKVNIIKLGIQFLKKIPSQQNLRPPFAQQRNAFEFNNCKVLAFYLANKYTMLSTIKLNTKMFIPGILNKSICFCLLLFINVASFCQHQDIASCIF